MNMCTKNKELLKLLNDRHALRLAYAASSDYVMRLAFERIKELQACRGKTELAPAILKQYESLVETVRDSVIIGAHLYALELTGAKEVVRKAVVATLDQKELRQDPIVTQTVGKMAARLVRRKLPRGKDLEAQDIDEIHSTLKKEVKP
jgi:hypothetical protein